MVLNLLEVHLYRLPSILPHQVPGVVLLVVFPFPTSRWDWHRHTTGLHWDGLGRFLGILTLLLYLHLFGRSFVVLKGLLQLLVPLFDLEKLLRFLTKLIFEVGDQHVRFGRVCSGPDLRAWLW